MRMHGTGVWSHELRYGDPVMVAELAAELEELGFSALWIPDVGGDLFPALDLLLASTRSAVVATGILNLWMHTPAETGAWWGSRSEADHERLLLGIGISHAPLIDARPGMSWEKPLATTRVYLEGLERAGIPKAHRCVAALGPKMLELDRERSAGAHPYLVTPDHTRIAREALGHDALLAVEQGIVFDTDAERARRAARAALAVYATLPNYTNNWKRLGYTDDDVADLSDRLVDALIVWGDVDTLAARVQAHVDAGADHVCVQLIGTPGDPIDRAVWTQLAPALTEGHCRGSVHCEFIGLVDHRATSPTGLGDM